MSQKFKNEYIYNKEKNNMINNAENKNKQKKKNWVSKKEGKDFLSQMNINDVQKYNGVHQEPPKQLESNLGDMGDVRFFPNILSFSNNDQNSGSYISNDINQNIVNMRKNSYLDNKKHEPNKEKGNSNEGQKNRNDKYIKNNSHINNMRSPYKYNKNDDPNNEKKNKQNQIVEKKVFNSQFSIQSDGNEQTIIQCNINNSIDEPNESNDKDNNYKSKNSSSSIIIIDNKDYVRFSNKNICNLNKIKKNDNNINNENNYNNINNKNIDNNINNENNDNNFNNINKAKKYNLPSSTNVNIINSNPYNKDPVSNHEENNNCSIKNESLLDNPYKNDTYKHNGIDNNNNNDNNNYIINNSSINIQVNESQKNHSMTSQNNANEQQFINSQPAFNFNHPKINNDRNAPLNPENNKNNISKSEKTVIKIDNHINSGNSNNQKGQKHILDRYKKVSRTGLANVGDSSYLNAVLQSLGHVRPFASYFLNPKNQEFIQSKIYSMPLSYVTYRLFTHLYPYPETNKIEIYSPESFLKILSFLKSPYGKQRNNPIDLLTYILNTLHEELNSKINNDQIIRKPYNFYYSKDNVIQNGISNFIDNNKSKISDVVCWFQLKESNCSNCGRSTFNFNSFNTYDLDIKNTYEYFLNDEKNYINISDCFSYGEMPKKCKSYCYNCKNRTIISRQSRIYSSPNVFIFLLDRGINFNENYFNIPFIVEEKIDLSDFVIQPNTSMQYKLTGIVSFNLQEQKYVSYCQSPIDSNWYLYNNEKVNQVFCEDILNNKNDNEIPCILYYKTI